MASTLTPVRIGLAGALPLVLLTVAVWWAQRADWVLYAVLGFGPARISVIAATDWALTCALPLSVGAAWGTCAALAPRGGTEGIAAAGQATAVMLLGASLAMAWLRATRQLTRTRRVLAGV